MGDLDGLTFDGTGADRLRRFSQGLRQLAVLLPSADGGVIVGEEFGALMLIMVDEIDTIVEDGTIMALQ